MSGIRVWELRDIEPSSGQVKEIKGKAVNLATDFSQFLLNRLEKLLKDIYLYKK